jgi:hypothetical protein
LCSSGSGFKPVCLISVFAYFPQIWWQVALLCTFQFSGPVVFPRAHRVVKISRLGFLLFCSKFHVLAPESAYARFCLPSPRLPTIPAARLVVPPEIPAQAHPGFSSSLSSSLGAQPVFSLPSLRFMLQRSCPPHLSGSRQLFLLPVSSSADR